ncbi:MAG: TrpB-like pyridoxal phosphate-dependent enzyme [Acidobacteriota bacterium]
MKENKFLLSAGEMPTAWYNILPDLKTPLAPPLHPGTKEPAVASDFSAIFPDNLIAQEFSSERFIEIPDEVLDAYAQSRPSPLIRAYALEARLGTPAKIFFKYEGVNSAGSHKSNTALAQAFYNKQAGVKRLVTETGAGQWGSALSAACKRYGMGCEVFMVKVSYSQKPYRRTFMQLFGADVHASPSELTEAGRRVLAEHPHSPGSLAIAISEAVECAVQRDDTKYALGSVLNHVLLHQTIIGEEARLQMEKAGASPDIVIACVGGGSNFAGLAFPFLRDKLSGVRRDMRVVAVEPASCPTLTRGVFAYDFGDLSGYTPLMKMYTLGHTFIPDKIHAGGLRYHGMSPIVSQLYADRTIEAEAYAQKEVFESAVMFAETEGIVPAPESSHAIRSAIGHALACRESGEAKTILFNLSGHGFFDLGSYDAYLQNHLNEHQSPLKTIEESIARLPSV